MADSNRVRLAYALESTYGTSPSGTYVNIRATGEGLKPDTNTVASQELRSDRNVVDLARVGFSASGDLNFELSTSSADGGGLEAWLMWGLGKGSYSGQQIYNGIAGTWASTGPFTGTFTCTGGSVGSFAPLQPFPNRWMRVYNSTAGNTGWYKVTAIDAPGTILTLTGFRAITNGAETALSCRAGANLVNGTDMFTFTLERKYEDLTTEYERFAGCAVDRISLAVTNDAIITGSFGLLGKTGASGSGDLGSGYTATTTNAVLTGVANVVGVLEGIAPITVTGLTLQIQNNLRSRQVVGTLGSVSLGQGSMVITGTLTAYFSSTWSDIVDKYLNNTGTSLALVVADSPTSPTAGNYYILDMPNVEFSSGQVLSTGINGDVMAELSFQALLYPNTGGVADGPYMIRFTKG